VNSAPGQQVPSVVNAPVAKVSWVMVAGEPPSFSNSSSRPLAETSMLSLIWSVIKIPTGDERGKEGKRKRTSRLRRGAE
jgi:hypothetical protein